MPSIEGKENFLRAMEMMELWNGAYLKSNAASEGAKNIIAEKEFVVVECKGTNNSSSNCDIYIINRGKIREMTTYIVDTSVNE